MIFRAANNLVKVSNKFHHIRCANLLLKISLFNKLQGNGPKYFFFIFSNLGKYFQNDSKFSVLVVVFKKQWNSQKVLVRTC